MDLRALVTIEAWHNPRFEAAFEKDPRKAVEKLAARHGLDPSAAARFLSVEEGQGAPPLGIAPNPVGVAPARLRRVLAQKETGSSARPSTRIALSPEQREAIRQATGQEVAWLELTPEALLEVVPPSAVRAGMGPPSTWDC
jgi:hypothetical protein